MTDNSGMLTIVKYISPRNISIRFDDAGNEYTRISMSAIVSGAVADRKQRYGPADCHVVDHMLKLSYQRVYHSWVAMHRYISMDDICVYRPAVQHAGDKQLSAVMRLRNATVSMRQPHVVAICEAIMIACERYLG